MSQEDFKKYETSYRQYYGDNYDKALRNLKNTKKRMERQFAQKYPNAHLNRFSFNVVLSKTGNVTEWSVSFKVHDDQFLDITTEIKILKNFMQENCTGCREYGTQTVRFNRSSCRRQHYRIITENLLFTSMQGLDSQVISML